MNRENKYWRNRADLRMAEYHKDSDSTIFLINAAYDKAIRDINADINTIFKNYMKSSGIPMEKAKSLLNSKINSGVIFNIYKRILQKVKNKKIRQWLLNRLNAKAYSARITRLEALKESIYVNCKAIADVEIDESTKLYTKHINTAYFKNIFDTQKQIGFGFNVAAMPKDNVEEILKNKWSGTHYSKRVWKNTDVLADKLHKTIAAGLMNGTNSHKMALDIQDLSDYGKFAAERLIRTETTYITNMAEIQGYKECGVKKYVFVATLDLRTSEMCRKHDKKIYDVEKAVPGENLPPLHPFCRSVTIAYRDKETLNSMRRRARDPVTGKTYVLDKNMNYDDWYKKYVIDKYDADKAVSLEKTINNKASDKKQYEKYKEVLGKETPETFDKFQELKYNNSKEWELFKDYTKSRSNNMISVFSSFDDYKKYKGLIESDIVGLTTSNGIKITGQSKHFIERVLGTSKDPKTGRARDGVEISDISEAIQNGHVRTRKNDPNSVKFISDKCIVSVNPNTGKLIQVNPQ